MSNFILFYRTLQTYEVNGRILRFIFKDEYGKITTVKYKLKGIIKGDVEDNFIWVLDGRSVRFMRRARIIENIKPMMSGL